MVNLQLQVSYHLQWNSFYRNTLENSNTNNFVLDKEMMQLHFLKKVIVLGNFEQSTFKYDYVF